MSGSSFYVGYGACRDLLFERLLPARTARARTRRRRTATPERHEGPLPIQLVTGPRQVGKTTALLELAAAAGPRALYVAGDSPEAALPGFWEQTVARAEGLADEHGRALLLLDEAQLLPDWAARLKAPWDRWRRESTPVYIAATGSSALRLASGSRESLAGRFERITLTHWSAAELAKAFDLDPVAAAELLVRQGSYPGAMKLRDDPRRWAAYVHDAILEPAIGRDLLALAPIRKPALLRQVFAVAAALPAQIVSLQKVQGQLQDAGALETIAHYLALLEEAYLVAALPKFSPRLARRRSAPPKLVVLSNALLAVSGALATDGAANSQLAAWVENACLAHAYNAGQRVLYWREEPLEVDGVIEGDWGNWAIEVKTGRVAPSDLAALLEFARRFPKYRPLLVASEQGRTAAERAGVAWIDWREFLLHGPGASQT